MPKGQVRRRIFLMTATVAVAVGLYTSLAGAEAAPRYKVNVWYPGWGTPGASEYELLSSNIATVDKISPYWYALKPDGSVAAYEWAEDPKLMSLARDNAKAVMPLVTNEFDPERVHQILATESSRDAHARELTSLVVSKGYAGVDLDYEMLHAKDRDEFSAFVENLASDLHAEGKKLSIAVHPKTSEPGSWDGPQAQDWQRLGRAVDEFEIMTYDYRWDGSPAGPAAPPQWIDKVLTFAETQVPPYKIRMGLPYYGRDWQGTQAEDLVYTQVRSLIDEHSATVRRGSSGELYFTYPGGHTVYYQDYRSIDMKLKVLVREHPRVGGIAIWHVGGESQRYWAAVRNRLGR